MKLIAQTLSLTLILLTISLNAWGEEYYRDETNKNVIWTDTSGIFSVRKITRNGDNITFREWKQSRLITEINSITFPIEDWNIIKNAIEELINFPALTNQDEYIKSLESRIEKLEKERKDTCEICHGIRGAHDGACPKCPDYSKETITITPVNNEGDDVEIKRELANE